MDDLRHHLVRFSWYLRLRDGWILAQRTLWLACLACLFVQAVGRFWPIERLPTWTLAPFVIWLLAVVGTALLRPLPSIRVAHLVDAELKLKERLSTALILQGWEYAFTPSLISAQYQDALSAAQGIHPQQELPLRWIQRPLIVAVLLLAVILTLIYLPNPMDAVLAQRAAVAAASEEQATQIEKLRQEIEATEELSPEAQEEILRQLTELAEALRANPGDLEEAMAELSKAEQNLRQKLDANVTVREANLRSLTARLEALAGRQKDPNLDATEAASEALSDLVEQMSSMDEAQRQGLAQTLAQLSAQSAQSGDQALAQSLSALAQAIQSGDQEAASQAAQNTQEAMERVGAQIVDQAAREQALGQIQASRQALAQTGQSLAQNQGQGQGPGGSPAQGENQMPGQGQSSAGKQGQGQPGGGGGTQADTLPPGTSQGQAGRPQGNAPVKKPGSLDDQVYAPWQRSTAGDNELFIPGTDTGQGQTQVTEGQSPLPGAVRPALVPYQEVYYSYLRAANQAMERSSIPIGLENFVRAYFSQLEP